MADAKTDAQQPLVDETGLEMTEQEMPLRTAGDNNNMDARDLIPQEDPPAPTIPDKVQLKGPNGQSEEIQLTPEMFCFKDGPPGGWYGPFGFLRLVTYAFVAVAGIGAILLIFEVLTGPTIWGIFVRLLLIPAALLAAMAAYSHEGLANQVSEVARRNDEYAKMNDQFEAQLTDLEGVATKLDDLVSSGNMNLEKLELVINGLEQISDLGKLESIVRSFTDAEMREFMAAGAAVTKRLSNVAELKAFLESCISVITHNIPSFDLKNFRRYGLRGGIGLSIVSVLVAAVNTENVTEQHSLVEFMFFILDPHGQDRFKKAEELAVKHLKNHPKYGKKGAVDAEMKRLMNTVDKADKRGRVGEDEMNELVMAMLTTIADEKPKGSSTSLKVGGFDSDDE